MFVGVEDQDSPEETFNLRNKRFKKLHPKKKQEIRLSILE